ncbi:hypothetical protein K438DRAFT_1967359 [Mycena galopus ATCC 62051]|nr:hypothetical protein K438DRAFT_1967359 [Mycena galopus ATCC 62051]
MTRKKNGQPRGRKSDFTGEKEAWLDGFREKLQEAGDDPGGVYTDATNAFILRYGYDLAFTENVEGDPEADPPVIEAAADDEEKARRSGIQKKLRAKLSNYFRNRWRAKKLHAASIKAILGTMQSMAGPKARPRRKAALAVYTKLHYATRVKPRFDAIWEDAKKTLPERERVAMSQDFARTCWQQEDKEFRNAVEMEGEEMHRVAMEEWKASRTIPEGSAEDYHNALESLNEVGIPLADALAERLGSHVVILVVGPVGSEQGEVCLRTVFSDTASLDTSRTWAQFDHKGFTAMETSITRYGRAAFGKKTCRDRGWPPLGDADSMPMEGLLTMDPNASPAAPAPAAPAAPAPAARVAPAPAAPVAPAPAAPVAPAPAAPAAPAPAARVAPAPAPAARVAPAPAPAPAARAAPAGDPPEDGTVRTELELASLARAYDRSEWSESLVAAYAYLSGKKWGLRWTRLLNALVEHEWSFEHPEEDGKLPTLQVRPQEFHDWMKEHRIFKDYAVRPEFGAELFDWWKQLGPPQRWADVGEGKKKEASRKASDFFSLTWSKLFKRGRNGVVLLILGLAWWGQSICNAAAKDGLGAEAVALASDELWGLLVEDIRWALDDVLTQGRAQMEAGDARRAREGNEEAAEKAAAAADKKAKKGKRTKRKRTDEEEEGSPPAKKVVTGKSQERPKPRPLTRSARTLRATNPSGFPAAGEEMETSGSGDTSMKDTAVEAGTDAPQNTAVLPRGPDSLSALVVDQTSGRRSPSLNPAVTSQPDDAAPANSGSAVMSQDVDIDGPDAEQILKLRAELAELRKTVNTTNGLADPLDLDPFANDFGLTPEELAEVALDQEADEEEEDY